MKHIFFIAHNLRSLVFATVLTGTKAKCTLFQRFLFLLSANKNIQSLLQCIIKTQCVLCYVRGPCKREKI